jgi:hypothetical protein
MPELLVIQGGKPYESKKPLLATEIVPLLYGVINTIKSGHEEAGVFDLIEIIDIIEGKIQPTCNTFDELPF